MGGPNQRVPAERRCEEGRHLRGARGARVRRVDRRQRGEQRRAPAA